MAERGSKVPVRLGTRERDVGEWWPLRTLRRDIDRLFEDFPWSSWRRPFGTSLLDVEPFWRGETWGVPTVDIAEKTRNTNLPPSYPEWTRATSTSHSLTIC